jgi:hypothetical protein
MMIKEMLEGLENASGPVVKMLQKGPQHKVIVLGFRKGMVLKEHKTPFIAKLLVINRCIRYREAGRDIILDKYADLDIPVNIVHAVEALEDSVCLLMQSNG